MRRLPKLMPYRASAGAIGLRPHAEGDEPRHAAADYLDIVAQAAHGAAGCRAVVGFHRRLSRRNRRRFRGDADARARGRLRLDLFVQIFAAPGHARRRARRPDRRRCVKTRAPRRASGAARRAAAGLQRGDGRARRSTCCSRSRAGMRARSPARAPYMQAVHVEGPTDLIGAMRRVKIVAAGSNSLAGRLQSSRGDAGLTTIEDPRLAARAPRRGGAGSGNHARLRGQSLRLAGLRPLRPESRQDRTAAATSPPSPMAIMSR